MAKPILDMLFWDVHKLTGGTFALGWNWGWGYYRALKDMGIAGYGGIISGYKHTPSDVVMITDGIHMCIRNEPQITPDFFARIRREKKKLVVIIYESIFANDRNIEGGPSNSFMYILKNNAKWKAMLKFANLIVCADPHDAWTINNNKNYKHYPKTIYLPLAVDEKVLIPQPERIWKSCFIGSIWIPGRKAIIHPILPSGLLDLPQLYHKGNDYETALNSTRNYNKVAGKYAINLNVRTMFAGLQLRIFETMAMGRVCLSQKPTNLPGRMDLYKSLKNVLWYDKDGDITWRLKTYLKNQEGMIRIGNNARQEILDKHTHTHRIKSILANLK